MADDIVYDEILGELRMGDVSGGTGGSSSYVGGNGITLAGGTVTATVAAVDGNRIILSGGTATFNPVADIVTVTGASVTLNPDTAYKIYATSQAITLNANPPAAGKWAYDGHLEIFVANTGYVVTGANVVLANALEPDSVNNCTVRFHDGIAIISVEDHVAGYIVVSATGSTAGTLPYALTSATQEYVAFDASLNGTTVDLAGATTYAGEKHVVGNGYAETTLTGAVDCGTSKFTVANLALSDVQVTGGVMTLGDVYIPSGATVAVNGGGLAVEKVNADGGTIDLGGTNIVVSSFTAYISGATITGFAAGTGVNGAVKTIQSGHISATSCTFSGNDGTYGPAVCAVGGSIILSGCSVYGNAGATCEVYAGGSATILRSKESYLEQRVGLQHSATFEFVGNNTLKGIVSGAFSGQSGFVTLASGTTLDLRSNSNPTPINPGGSITFEAGGATVLVNSGTEATSSSYMMDNVTLPAGAKLTNTAVVDLGGTNVGIPGNATASASGCTFTNGNGNPNGGAFRGNALFLSGCNITNCRANNGGAINTASGNLVSCVVSGNSALYYGGGVSIPILSMSYCTITGNTAGSGYGGGGLFVAAGNTANATSCNVSGNVDRKNDGTEFPCDYNIYGSALIDGGTVGTILFNGGTASFAGNVRIDEVKPYNTSSGSVIISSGTTLDLRSNSNPTPINPGGSITFEAGGATVYPSAGSSNAAIIGGVTVATLSNSSVLTISSTNLPTDAYFENCTLTSTNSSIYYVLYGSRKMTLKNVTLDTKIYMDSAYGSGGIVEISGTFISTSNGYIGVVTSNSSVVNINAGAVLTLGQSIVVASIVIEGDITVGGVTVRAGTYTKINPDGTTE